VIAAFSPFLAWRYFVQRRINWLSTAGVMFAVWAMLLVDSVFTGFVSSIRQDVANSSPHLLVTDLPHDTDYQVLQPVIEAVEGVASSAPRLRHYGLLQPLRAPQTINRAGSSQIDFDHARSGFALLLGVDPARELATGNLRDWLARESPFGTGSSPLQGNRLEQYPFADVDERQFGFFGLPGAVDWAARKRAGLPIEPDVTDHRSNTPGVLFGYERALRLPWLRHGDPMELVCVSFTEAGGKVTLHTHPSRVAFAGCYATGHRGFDEPTVLLPIETLRTMLGADAADPDSIALVTDVAVRVRESVAPDALPDLQRRLRDAVQKALGGKTCSVLDWREQNPVMLGAIASEQAMMQFVLFVVMIVAATVIFATLHLMVVQKTRDIGILASLGGSPRSIGAVFLGNGFAVAAIGTVLGVALGVVSVRFLNPVNEWLYATCGLELFPRALFDLSGIPVRLEPSWIASVAIGAMLLSLFVAWLPARKAARLHPVQALSHE
jgi:ABC-type lipoprotein release transport system permease subunit